MKKPTSVLFLFLLLILGSCEQTPEETVARVAQSFAEAYYNLEYEKAVVLATPESASPIIFRASNVTEEHINLLRIHGKAKVTVLDTALGEYGITARVKCKVENYIHPDFLLETTNVIAEQEEVYTLIKTDSGWLVDLKQQ